MLTPKQHYKILSGLMRKQYRECGKRAEVGFYVPRYQGFIVKDRHNFRAVSANVLNNSGTRAALLRVASEHRLEGSNTKARTVMEALAAFPPTPLP